jgi:hypothetical protein
VCTWNPTTSNLIKAVQDRIQTTKFELPQTSERSMQHLFCNEQVYGNMNLLMMTGMLYVPAIDSESADNTAP